MSHILERGVVDLKTIEKCWVAISSVCGQTSHKGRPNFVEGKKIFEFHYFDSAKCRLQDRNEAQCLSPLKMCSC